MSDKFLKLTNAVYKVLEFFPESDPLKNRAKDKALAIMENLVLINETSGWASFQKEKIKVQLLDDIDMMLGYLWIGKSQSWLNSVNYLIISNQYERIKKEFEPIKIEVGIESTQIVPEHVLVNDTGTNLPAQAGKEGVSVFLNNKKDTETGPISDRQKKILEFLRKNEKAQVMDLQTILPDITKRTIRRDLDELMESGKIVRMGDFNQVFYTIKR